MSRVRSRRQPLARLVGLVALLVLLGPAPVGVAKADDDDPIDALRHYFEAVDTLAGEFRQTTRDANGDVVEQASGEFVMARPQRFVWDYRTPWEQRIVADGERLWVYDVALEQVVVRPLDEALGVGAAQLLSGDFADLRERFALRIEDARTLLLQPTDPAWDFQRVRLELRDGVPASISVADGMGQRVEVRLLELAVNPVVDDGRFAFEPPAGVDVLQGQ